MATYSEAVTAAETAGLITRRSPDHVELHCPHPDHDDLHASARLSRGRDERPLLTCHSRGCDFGEAMAALLGPSTVRTTTAREHAWRDADGILVATHVRLGKGNFPWRFEPGSCMADVAGLLYRAARASQLLRKTLTLVEGERDVETMQAAGIAAVCSPWGAGGRGWTPELTRAVLALSTTVRVIADDDEAGHRLGRRIVEDLRAAGAAVEGPLVCAGHNDVTDLALAGGDVRLPGAYRVLAAPEVPERAVAGTTGPSPGTPPVPFPYELLPPEVSCLVGQLGTAMCVPHEMVAVASLGAMLACTSGRFVAAVEPGWEVGASAYLVHLRRSGGRKTPTMRAVYAPLRRRQNELHREWGLQDEEGRGPSPRVVVKGNATGEGLGLRWRETGGRLHIADSEGAWWDILAGRYSDHPTWDELLSGWDGDDYEVIRSGRPSFIVPEAWLSACLLVQPGALDALASQPRAEELGLLGRLLVSAAEDVPLDVDVPACTTDALDAWDRFISSAAQTFWGLAEPQRIPLMPDARELLDDVRMVYDARERADLAHCPSWASKAAGHAVSLGLCVSRCELTRVGWGSPMSAADMAVGAGLMEYFADQAKRNYPTAPSPNAAAARQVGPWVAAQEDMWSRREMYRAHRRAFPGGAVECQGALDLLADQGIIEEAGQAERGAVVRGGEKYAQYRTLDAELARLAGR